MTEASTTVTTAPAEVRAALRRIRIFSSPAREPRFRRATDVVLLVPAFVALAILIATYPPGPFGRSVAAFLNAVPGFTQPVWLFLYDLLATWTLALLVTAVVSRRGFVLGQAAVAFLLAVAFALVSARLAAGDWPELADLVRRGADAPSFPDVRIAEAAAVLLTISPRLVQPLQRACRWMLLLGFLGAFFVDSTVPSGVAAGLLIGVVAAAAVRLAFGTSVGRPGLDAVAAALAELGSRRAGSNLMRGRSQAWSASERATSRDGRCSSRCTAATPPTTSCSRSFGGRSGTRTAARACASARPRWPSTRPSSPYSHIAAVSQRIRCSGQP